MHQVHDLTALYRRSFALLEMLQALLVLVILDDMSSRCGDRLRPQIKQLSCELVRPLYVAYKQGSQTHDVVGNMK